MVNLEYFKVDEQGKKAPIQGALGFGSMFKGSRKKVPITIFNSGDTPAVSPEISIREYPGGYSEPYKWKKVSFDENKNFGTSLKLPDIGAGQWLRGKDIRFEDFNSYPTVAGTKPDQAWLLTEDSSFAWEVYNGWLQHNVDSRDGKAVWTELFEAKNFEFSMRVTVRDGAYAGVIVRDVGNTDTGYIVLVQAMASELENLPRNEGVIQIYSGSFSQGIREWKKLYTSTTTGIRGTHDFFKLKMVDNKFMIWYKNEDDEKPLFVYEDPEATYNNASRPVICCHAGYGSILTYFDDIKMEIENNDGVVWIENTIASDTGLYATQYSILNVAYGGVE